MFNFIEQYRLRRAKTKWNSLFNSLCGKNTLEQITLINQWWNKKIKYKQEQRGLNIWKTPLTSLKDGVGDCEDYAIAKVCSIHRASLSTSLYLSHVVTTKALFIEGDNIPVGTHHMIAIVDVEGVSFIMDNLVDIISPLKDNVNYKELYSIDVLTNEVITKGVRRKNKAKAWEDVLSKMEAQGISFE